jgi:protein-disulfide isomerase
MTALALRKHAGASSGVNGTPTFFINGVRHNGGWALEPLLDGVREALD